MPRRKTRILAQTMQKMWEVQMREPYEWTLFYYMMGISTGILFSLILFRANKK